MQLTHQEMLGKNWKHGVPWLKNSRLSTPAPVRQSFWSFWVWNGNGQRAVRYRIFNSLNCSNLSRRTGTARALSIATNRHSNGGPITQSHCSAIQLTCCFRWFCWFSLNIEGIVFHARLQARHEKSRARERGRRVYLVRTRSR